MQEQPKAEHEAQQPDQGHNEPPGAAIRQSVVEQPTSGGPKKGYFSKFKNWVSFLTLLFVGAYTVLTFCILQSAQNQVRISRDVEQQELRAYVYLATTASKFPPETIQRPPDRYGITLTVVNGGKTWARNLITRLATIPKKGDVDSWNDAKWDVSEPIVLGPGQSLPLQFGNIWLSEKGSEPSVPHIAAGSQGFQYLAWITYDDAFDTQPFRQTQISQRVNAAEGFISFTYFSKHNCADTDCP